MHSRGSFNQYGSDHPEQSRKINGVNHMNTNKKNSLVDVAATVSETLEKDFLATVEKETDLVALASDSAELSKQELELRDAIAKAMQAKGLVSVSPSLATMAEASKVGTVVSELASRIVTLCKCHEKRKSYTVKTSDLIELCGFRKEHNAEGQVISVRNSLEKELTKAVQTLMKGTDGKVCKDTGKITPASNPVKYSLQAPSNRNGQRLVIFFQD
jgi:hypothetical protein